MELITHHIDGADVESESGAKFDSVDPYTRSAYAEVALGGRPRSTARSPRPDGRSTRGRGRGWGTPSAAPCCTGWRTWSPSTRRSSPART